MKRFDRRQRVVKLRRIGENVLSLLRIVGEKCTFTIGKDALQRAYSTIPDLRSTQMYFGLSVDLEWKTGLKFNVIID